jgi:hypothetical protein
MARSRRFGQAAMAHVVHLAFAGGDRVTVRVAGRVAEGLGDARFELF